MTAARSIQRRPAARDGSHRRALALALDLARPRRRALALGLGSIVIATGASLLPPWLAGEAVDAAASGESLGTFDEIVLGLAAALVVAAAAQYASVLLIPKLGHRLLMDLRQRLVERMVLWSPATHDRLRPGELISRMTADIDTIQRFAFVGVNVLVSGVLVLAGTAVALVLIDATLALLCAPLLPVAAAIMLVSGRHGIRVQRAAAARLTDLSAELQEQMAGIRAIRAFGATDRSLATLERLDERNRRAQLHVLRHTGSVGPLVEVITIAGVVVAIAYGGMQVVDGHTEVGTIVSFVAYLTSALSVLPDLANAAASGSSAAGALDDLAEVLERPTDDLDPPGARDAGPLKGAITLDGVTFSYADGPEVLHDVSLAIRPGETVALVGRTGAGKSTVLKLLMGFYAPDRGAVRLDGADLRELTHRSVRSQLGVVPQEPFLFTGTVADNIAIGRPDADPETIAAVLESLGLDAIIARLPDGLHTAIGVEGIELSSGEQQAIALARAMLARPPIVLLDEPVANVDPETQAHVDRGLKALLEGRTALIIAHRPSTMRIADRVVVMEHGRVVEEGAPEEILRAGGRFAAFQEHA